MISERNKPFQCRTMSAEIMHENSLNLISVKLDREGRDYRRSELGGWNGKLNLRNFFGIFRLAMRYESWKVEIELISTISDTWEMSSRECSSFRCFFCTIHSRLTRDIQPIDIELANCWKIDSDDCHQHPRIGYGRHYWTLELCMRAHDWDVVGRHRRRLWYVWNWVKVCLKLQRKASLSLNWSSHFNTPEIRQNRWPKCEGLAHSVTLCSLFHQISRHSLHSNETPRNLFSAHSRDPDKRRRLHAIRLILLLLFVSHSTMFGHQVIDERRRGIAIYDASSTECRVGVKISFNSSNWRWKISHFFAFDWSQQLIAFGQKWKMMDVNKFQRVVNLQHVSLLFSKKRETYK